MQWFGWLTKGHYEVTMLDRMLVFGEMLVVILIGIIFYVAYEALTRRN